MNYLFIINNEIYNQLLIININLMNPLSTGNNTTESAGLTTEEITITVLYYSIAFLIFVVSLIFINKRI